MNLTVDSAVLPASVMQILSGLESITSGLAGLSNNSGDRHANKSKVYKHHAKLAVNAAMTLTDFLLDSKEYQADKWKTQHNIVNKIHVQPFFATRNAPIGVYITGQPSHVGQPESGILAITLGVGIKCLILLKRQTV